MSYERAILILVLTGATALLLYAIHDVLNAPPPITDAEMAAQVERCRKLGLGAIAFRDEGKNVVSIRCNP